ncbi:hypothetical protein ACJVC5_18265 [Peredibacter sp. HCB2-198]|uniref:hypothetical protein n=1 Tax=Peredibacter sp. HCB2-198 TaxID=3383025 RepID=UPI0038B602A6
MRFFILSFFILTSVSAKDICFPSTHQAMHMAAVYRTHAKGLMMKFAMIKKQLQPTTVELSKRCDNCLEIKGDPYIKGVIEEKYEELELDKFSKETVPGIPVDVSMGRLIPVTVQNGHTIYNPQYVSFLSLPEKTSNVFYDADKVPIEVSARMVHPKYMEYTFKYKDRTHTMTEKVDRPVACMFPYDRENEEDVKFFKTLFKEEKFMKEGEKYLPIRHFEIKAFLRNY